MTAETIDSKMFDEACGVGVTVTSQQISDTVARLLSEKKDELLVKRHQMMGPLLLALRQDLRWANGLLLKEELDRQLLATLGPKEDAAKKIVLYSTITNSNNNKLETKKG